MISDNVGTLDSLHIQLLRPLIPLNQFEMKNFLK